MMEKPAKKQRKCTISEQDGTSILQRYTLKTVLAMLQEVSHCADAKKIDWNGLVEKTSTGISNAREYQMLWRHLAYRDTLLEKFEDGAQPLDDDSDLEMELEAFPSASGEVSAEAAACVKVLIASATLSEANPNGSTVEGPLTINVPNFQSSTNLDQPSCSMQGTNIVVPVSVQKQPAPATTIADGFDKRKRKPWSEAEDLELIAAVQKCGEGNWANILRGDFKGDRTASQLSQRWAIIRKRHGNGNGNGNGNLNVGSSSSSNVPQLSEAQLAARHAMSLALNMPVKNLTSNSIGQAGAIGANKSFGSSSKANSARTNGTNTSPLTPATAAEPSSISSNSFLQSQKLPQENISKSVGPAEKPRPPMKKPMLKPTSTPSSSDAMVRATAVAAGARIASASDAATLLKAAQGKNAIHIMPSAGGGGGGSIKSSMPGGATSISETLPNVHYIRTGLAHTPLSNYAATTPSVPSPGPVNKAVPPPPVKPVQTANGTSSDGILKQNSNELPSMKEVKTIGEASVAEPVSAVTKEQVQGGDGARVSEKSQELVQDNRKAPPVPSAGVKVAPGTTAVPVSSLTLKRTELSGTSRTENPVNSSSLKTTDLKGVLGSKNPVGSLNLKAAVDSKVTAGTPSLVSSLNMKTTELKGRNGVQNPVSSLTSKAAELKDTNGSKTTEIKGTVGSKNPASLSTLKTTEIKGANGSQKPISSSTSKVTEIKGTNGAQNPISLSTLKTAELKGAKNPVTMLVSKTSELKTTSGVQNPVGSSTSKTVVMKSTNSVQNPVSLAISKAAELKGTSGGQNQNGAPTLKNTELKGTKGGHNPVSAPVLKTTELKGTSGGQNPVSAPILKTTELKGTNGGQNPVRAPALKTSDLKGTTGAPNSVGTVALKTSELKGTTGAPNPVSSPTVSSLQQNKVNTQPKNAGGSGNDIKTSGSQPGACKNKEKSGQHQNIDNMEVDSRSVVMDVEKNGEKVNLDKMDVDVPAIVKDVKIKGENQKTGNKTQ